MTESRQDRIRQLVQNARHGSVTADRLELRAGSDIHSKLGRGDSRTIYYHIGDEQPHFIFTAKRETPDAYGDDAPYVPNRSRLGDVLHVVTAKRWLTIIGTGDGEEKIEVELEDIEATNYDTESRLSSHIPDSITNNRIYLQGDEFRLEVPVSNNHDNDDFVQLLGYLREIAGARPRAAPLERDASGFTIGGIERDQPDEQDIRAVLDELPPEAMDEADELVSSSKDADRLLRDLTKLLEEYETEQSEQTVDDFVSDAESVDELRDSVRSPVERQVDGTRENVNEGATIVREKLEEADPDVVARWALTGGRIAKPLATAASGSTIPWLLASLALGSVGGVLIDGAADSKLTDLDHAELLEHATAMAEVGENLDEINGEAVGMLLGSTSYFAQTLAPEEYAEWVTKADTGAIMEGADRGAQFAIEHGDNRQIGGVFGGAVGLLGGYATNSTSPANASLSQILDSDLYTQVEG